MCTQVSNIMIFACSFRVNEDSSSEEETVYIKKPPKVQFNVDIYTHVCTCTYTCIRMNILQKINPLLKSPMPLPPCPEGESKAEWAVKNMYYNPGTHNVIVMQVYTMS